MPSRNNDFHQWLLQNPQGLKAPLRKELTRRSGLMVNDMRARTDDRTGTLDRSIRAEEGRDELSVFIRAGGELTTKDGYDYAIGKEFGTTKQPAEPFFWPVYRIHKKQFFKVVNDLVTKHFSQRGRLR